MSTLPTYTSMPINDLGHLFFRLAEGSRARSCVSTIFRHASRTEVQNPAKKSAIDLHLHVPGLGPLGLMPQRTFRSYASPRWACWPRCRPDASQRTASKSPCRRAGPTVSHMQQPLWSLLLQVACKWTPQMALMEPHGWLGTTESS